jgi:hypothetical protein
MTLRRPHEDALLTSEEIAVIRRALTACSQVLTWAGQHGDPEFREMLAEVTLAAEGHRCPAGLAYDVNLAIDYLDFAPAARSAR